MQHFFRFSLASKATGLVFTMKFTGFGLDLGFENVGLRPIPAFLLLVFCYFVTLFFLFL